MSTTYEEVRDIITDELGDITDGYVVTDVLVGYAEPGYGDDETIVVLGNWNPKRYPREGDAPLTDGENVGPRLADKLEDLEGVELQWLDEWAECIQCHRAMRIKPDSYSWSLNGAFIDDDGYVCTDCLKKHTADYLEEWINDHSRAVTWLNAAEMEAAGFVQWEPEDPQTYENGWHPGQTDDPQAILEAIHEHNSDAQVVFRLDETSQFYICFSAWIKKEEV